MIALRLLEIISLAYGLFYEKAIAGGAHYIIEIFLIVPGEIRRNRSSIGVTLEIAIFIEFLAVAVKITDKQELRSL